MPDNDTTTPLARRGRSASIARPLPGRPAAAPPPDDATGGRQSVLAEVTRRRLRVNFLQRYESRGVDRYREALEAAARDKQPTLDFTK